jgi:diacylglycerol kinase (ATP)
VHAAAILGPGVSECDLRPFRLPGVTLSVEPDPAFADMDAVLIFGGDGTVHHQLAALAQAALPSIVVPHGSGNDFACALGLPSREASLTAWKRFCSGERNLRRIDLGIIRPLPDGPVTYFCEAAGVGIDSAVIQHVNRMPSWLRRNGGYLIATLTALVCYRTRPTTVSLPEAETAGVEFKNRISEPALTVLIGNGSRYGDGMRIAPNADFADGQLDVCFVRHIPRLRVPGLLHTLYRGTHIQLPAVEYFRAARLRIATDPPLELCADGEYVCRTPAEIAVAPLAISVIVDSPSASH